VPIVISVLKLVAVLVAAVFLGNWYQSESRRLRARGRPWYAVYLTLPGVLIILVILLPILFWMTR
jgi:uncharacterized membrane protein YidH (DUF202 family)